MLDSSNATVSYGYFQAREFRRAVSELSSFQRDRLILSLSGQTNLSTQASYIQSLLLGKTPSVALGFRRGCK